MIKKKLLNADEVNCFEFFDEFVFTGYGDGLICSWHIGQSSVEEIEPDFLPLLGHTNKINQLKASVEVNKLFSCSDDCTLRQWSLDNIGVCDRVFKFPDPVTCCLVSSGIEPQMLFVGSWDKMVRAIILQQGIVDRAFVASREAIKCLHQHENKLYVAG
jgi:WD40 repeat protein